MLSTKKFLIHLLKFAWQYAHCLELSQEVIHLAMHELLTSGGNDFILGIGAHEIAQSALCIYNATLL